MSGCCQITVLITVQVEHWYWWFSVCVHNLDPVGVHWSYSWVRLMGAVGECIFRVNWFPFTLVS